MRILYIHQYFRTPEEGGIIRSYYLAKSLVDAGHEVVMLTGTNSGTYEVREVEGIEVHYLPVAYRPEMGFVKRCWSFAKFAWKAYRKAKTLESFQRCFATSTPLTVGWTALKLKKKFKLPFYFEVRDLWPEAPVQVGAIKQTWLKTLLYRFESKIYHEADKIVALSPGMRDYIERIVDRQKINIISNISDCQFFTPSPRNEALDQKYKVSDKFTLTYIGAVGVSNHLENLIDIAHYAQTHNYSNFHVLLAGKGPRYEAILQKARELELDNISFLGFMNKDRVKEVLQVTDAVYTTFSEEPVLATNSPNKFFDGLAAGKLSVVNTNGWLKEIVEKRSCGFYVPSDQPQVLFDKLKPIFDSQAQLLSYQKNARETAEAFFSRKIQTQKFVQIFEHGKSFIPLEESVYILTA